MVEETLNIPEPRILTGTNNLMPYFFIGDDIFGLHKHFMKPFNRNGPLTNEQKIFNYRISRPRLTIENSFGILTSRWRVFEKPLGFKLSTSEYIIMGAIALHNFIMTHNLQGHSNSTYGTQSEPGNGNPVEDENFIDMGSSVQQRNILAQYFSSPAGSVPWQNNYI